MEDKTSFIKKQGKAGQIVPQIWCLYHECGTDAHYALCVHWTVQKPLLAKNTCKLTQSKIIRVSVNCEEI